MKQMSLTKIAVGASTFACAALLSFNWSEQRGVSLSVENAQARVGRPLTPVSVAGVARRQNRRAAYVAGGTVGMGRYGGGPNNLGGLVGGDDPGTGGGAGGLYYGGRVRGASASYYGGYPSGAWGGVSSSDYALYIRNQHDSGLAR
jgi:hypothetical protein